MTPSLHRMAGDERLARMVTSGNDGAFSALYDRYHDVLVRYCRSLVRDDQDALDAFQSTMLNALRALREDRRRAPVRPWLFRIAHNESISVLRRRPASEPLDDRQIGTVDVHRTAEDREALAGLLEDLGSLTEHQRGALLLRELGGLAYEDVASVLDTTPLAARQAVFAARASLHDQREGRELPCAMVQRRLSDTDRRASRTRAIRAHLRRCDDCRGFASAIGRRRRAAVLVPIPPAFASGGLLTSILDASAGGGAGVVGGGAVASGLVAKAAVALSAAVVATGAAERGGTMVHRATGGATAEAQAEPAPKAIARASASQASASSSPVQRASAAATTTSTTPATRTASDPASTHSAPTSGDAPTLDEADDRDPVRLSASGDEGDGYDDARAWGGDHHRGSYDGGDGVPDRDASMGDAASGQPSRPIAARPRRPGGTAQPMSASTTTSAEADATETTTTTTEPTTTTPATTTTPTEAAAPAEPTTSATTTPTTTTTATTPAAATGSTE